MKNAIYDPNQFGSYQDYIIDFLTTNSAVASCINPEKNSQGMDLGRLMDECSSPLPISKSELAANYKKAVRNNELEAWLYYYTDIMMQYWLDSQGQFKPEILAALQSRRIDERPSLEQVLYCDASGQPDPHKTAILEGKFIVGMVKNLVEVVSNEIMAEIKSSNNTEEVKEDLLAEQIHIPQNGLDPRLLAFPEKVEQEIKKQATRIYLTQFTSDVQQDQTKVITFAKLQEYRQKKGQQAIQPKPIANTVSQMVVLGGVGLIVLGTALILSGVGTIPGLAVIGAGAALATGGFIGMVFSDKAASFQAPSAKTKPASVSRESSVEVSSRLQAHKLAIEFQKVRAINIESSSTDSSPESSPRDYQINESATKKSTWGQWARSGFGLFAVSRSEEEKMLLPNNNNYDTYQQQSETPTP